MINKPLLLRDLRTARGLGVLQHAREVLFSPPMNEGAPLCACVMGYCAVGSGLVTLREARVMAWRFGVVASPELRTSHYLLTLRLTLRLTRRYQLAGAFTTIAEFNDRYRFSLDRFEAAFSGVGTLVLRS